MFVFLLISKEPIILHIGTMERKNLKRTIKALEGIKCKLRIVGKGQQKIKQRLLSLQLKKKRKDMHPAYPSAHSLGQFIHPEIPARFYPTFQSGIFLICKKTLWDTETGHASK